MRKVGGLVYNRLGREGEDGGGLMGRGERERGKGRVMRQGGEVGY